MRAKTPSADIEIPAELQSAWTRQLAWDFDHINYQYARSRLRQPLFRIGHATAKLGEWDPNKRTIMISAQHILDNSWECVLDTLRHEMAHQFVNEVFGLRDVAPHGEAFREACKILRCDASPTARSDESEKLETSKNDRDRILARIKDLLALAGSPNENEAANAMRMAQKYLLKYNLDLDEIDAERNYEVRHFGNCAARTQEYEYTLSAILQEHFFVLTIWSYSYDARRARAGKILEACGTPQNLEIASYVYDYVMQVAESLWKTRRKELAKTRAPGKRGTKFQYLAGLLRGLKEKLDRQRQEIVEERGLVLQKDSGLAAFYRHQNPKIARVSTQGVSRNQQFDAGREDGKKINIHRGVAGDTASRGRRLAGPSD